MSSHFALEQLACCCFVLKQKTQDFTSLTTLCIETARKEADLSRIRLVNSLTMFPCLPNWGHGYHWSWGHFPAMLRSDNGGQGHKVLEFEQAWNITSIQDIQGKHMSWRYLKVLAGVTMNSQGVPLSSSNNQAVHSCHIAFRFPNLSVLNILAGSSRPWKHPDLALGPPCDLAIELRFCGVMGDESMRAMSNVCFLCS